MNHPAASDNVPHGLPIPGWACALGVAQAVLFVAVLTLLGLP
jgi:hypothetical protein